jgi:O-antigen/teichoic acid export membrane protein
MTKLFSTTLGRNTLWSLSGYGLRLMLQAAYFIVIARCLGPGQYGAFIAVTALCQVISPFVGLGTGNLLVKNVARDPHVFGEYWGKSLFVTLASGFVMTAVAVGACRLLIPHSVPFPAILLLAISDLIFVKLLDMAVWAFQAFEKLGNTAALNVTISLTRLIGIVALACRAARPEVFQWSVVYLAGSIFSAVAAVLWATFKLGAPRLALERVRGELSEGVYFCFGFSSLTIYNDIDKTMMARLSTLDAAGIYAAAYRLIDVSFLPVRAVLNAAYPGFFRTGAHGVNASMNYGARLMRHVLPYALFACAALMIGAPIVPHILGRDYASVTEALRWLALLPVLKTFHYFIADSLTGAGHQAVRTGIQAAIAVFNVVVNLWVIPAYGWHGAAWSSLASDGLLLLSLWTAASILRRRHDASSPSIALDEAAMIEPS